MRAERLTLSNTNALLVAVCVIVSCLVLVAGCSGSRLRRTPTAAQDTPWFCQLNETRDNWECVQDAELARRPRPERLPTDVVEPETEPAPAIQPGVTYEPELAPEPRIGSSGTSPVATAATGAAIIETTPAPQPAQVEAPVAPLDLMSLPGDMYAVQLIAMANEPLANDFVRDHDIGNAMTLMLGRDGSLYYVVLLGIYESYGAAQRAVDHRPSSLANIKPWIRSLASIQQGVREARSLASGSE